MPKTPKDRPIVTAMLLRAHRDRNGRKKVRVIAQPVAKGIVELEVYYKGRIARVRLSRQDQDALISVFTNSQS